MATSNDVKKRIDAAVEANLAIAVCTPGATEKSDGWGSSVCVKKPIPRAPPATASHASAVTCSGEIAIPPQ